MKQVKINNEYYTIDLKNNKIIPLSNTTITTATTTAATTTTTTATTTSQQIDNNNKDNKDNNEQDTNKNITQKDITNFVKANNIPDTKVSDDQGEQLIINLGLPKSGTESLHTSFWTIHKRSAHWAINGNNKTLCRKYYPVDSVTVGGNLSPRTTYPRIVGDDSLTCYVGVIIQRALSNGLPPLHFITREGYSVFSQMDVIDVDHNIFLWPQFEMLDEFFKYYPKAHYIYTRREFIDSHIASLNAYNGLLSRFDKAGVLSKFEGQSDSKSSFENCKVFIEKTREMTLNAFKARPDIKFLDICIDCENANVSEKINNFLGITNFKYEHKNSGRYDKLHTAAPTPPHTIKPND
jgi:hypothetical protein